MCAGSVVSESLMAEATLFRRRAVTPLAVRILLPVVRGSGQF